MDLEINGDKTVFIIIESNKIQSKKIEIEM